MKVFSVVTIACIAAALPSAAQMRINGSQVVEGTTNYAEDAGNSDAYAVSIPINSYQAGAQYCFKAATANTGAASLNIANLGAKTIKKAAGGITTDLADSDIRAGQRVCVMFDGTNMQMLSQLGNASGTPGGSDGQLQYNHSGAFGGLPLVTAIASPGVDTNIPSEKAVRGAISSAVSGLAGMFTFRKGEDDASVNLPATISESSIFVNELQVPIHVTSVYCICDAGAPVVRLSKGGVSITSGDITCSTAGVAGASMAAAAALASREKLDLAVISGGGSAKRITITGKVSVD